VTVTLDEVLGGLRPEGTGLSADLPDNWLQGRTAYGGLSAAIVVETALRRLNPPQPLRAAQFAYVGPASGRLVATPTVLRQGKSSLFAAVDLVGDAGLAVRATLVFGAARAPGLDHDGIPPPSAPQPETCKPHFEPGAGPRFAGNFDARRVTGPSTTGLVRPSLTVWIRNGSGPIAHGLAGLFALADASPSPALQLLGGPARLSTMVWSVDVLTEAVSSRDDWWLLQSDAERVVDGISAQSIRLWDRDGRAVLASRQTNALYAES